MTLASRYGEAVEDALDRYPAVELLPFAISRACVAAFPVDGAGLSVTEGLRVPLGASDAMVVRAERLQTTLRDGPCLAAAQQGRATVADLAALRERWPLFAEQVLALTPFRSVASIPLLHPEDGPLAAVDLYSTDPRGQVFDTIAEMEPAIADPAAALLLGAPTTTVRGGITMPAWFDTEPANRRMDVWVAVGMLMARSTFGNDDALAALRGYAFSHELTLDEVASLLLSRALDPANV